MILEAAHHVAHKANLPADDQRIGQQSFPLERFGHVHTAAHPAGDQPYDQPDAVLFCQITKLSETVRHDDVNARTSRVGKRQGIFAQADLTLGRAASVMDAKRLEIAPVGEHAHDADIVLRQPPHILIHDIGTPVHPHIGSCVGCPIVAACEIFSGCEKNIVFLHDRFPPFDAFSQYSLARTISSSS